MTIDMSKQAAVVSLEKADAKAKEANLFPIFPFAELYMGGDHSGSMQGSIGWVVELGKRIAALALARLDPDVKFPFWWWASKVKKPVIVTLENLEEQRGRFGTKKPGVIEESHAKAPWGGTRLDLIISEITREHRRVEAKKVSKGKPSVPGLAIIQTDGYPDWGTEQLVRDALINASQDNLFFVIVGYGKESTFKNSFMEELNKGGWPGQVVDNVYFFAVPNALDTFGDEALYDKILTEIPAWRTAADGKVRGNV